MMIYWQEVSTLTAMPSTFASDIVDKYNQSVACWFLFIASKNPKPMVMIM